MGRSGSFVAIDIRIENQCAVLSEIDSIVGKNCSNWTLNSLYSVYLLNIIIIDRCFLPCGFV